MHCSISYYYIDCIPLQHFAVGTKVLTKNMKNAHRMGGKMDPKWLGPYTVKEVVGKGRYKLCSKTGDVKKLYSSCLLKEYIDPTSGIGIANYSGWCVLHACDCFVTGESEEQSDSNGSDSEPLAESDDKSADNLQTASESDEEDVHCSFNSDQLAPGLPPSNQQSPPSPLSPLLPRSDQQSPLSPLSSRSDQQSPLSPLSSRSDLQSPPSPLSPLSPRSDQQSPPSKSLGEYIHL